MSEKPKSRRRRDGDEDTWVAPPPRPSTEARRSNLRWIVAGAATALLLMAGLVFVVATGSSLPRPVELEASGARGGAGGLAVGDVLALDATVDPGVAWAVVVVAAATETLPLRVWVARTAAPSGDGETAEDGRARWQEAVPPPPGQRAILVIASREPMVDLPSLVLEWERALREPERKPDGFARDLEQLVGAAAGERHWRASKAIEIAVSARETAPPQEP